MKEILEVINKYTFLLRDKNLFLSELYFRDRGELNIDNNIFLFLKERINRICLDEYNYDLQLNKIELVLGFFSNENNYTVFDKKALYVLSTNDTDNEYRECNYNLNIIFWNQVESVALEYKDDGNHVVRFQIKEDTGNSSFYYDIINHGLGGNPFGAKRYNSYKVIVQLLNDINILNREETNIPKELFLKKIESLEEAINDSNYNEVLQNPIFKNINDYEACYYYHYYRMLAFHGLGENLKALIEVDDFRKFLYKNNIIDDFNLFELYGIAYHYNNDNLNSIKWYNQSLNEENKRQIVNLELVEEIQKNIQNSYKGLKKEFSEISFQKRKFILMSNQILTSDTEGLVVLKANDPPENIKFELSHPQLNEVYACHPNNHRSYILLKNYQKELFVDKLREFLLLLDTLGATKIDVINKNKSIDRNENSLEKNIAVKANYKGLGAKVDYKNKNDNENELERELNLAFHQKLSPKKAPYIPDGLVWFHKDLNWQRMANQRMNGSLMSHREVITSKQIESLSSHELTKVNAELNVLLAKVNADYQTDDISKSMSENFFELEIQVEFEDIDNLIQIHNNTKNALLNSNTLSSNSLDKYKKDVLFMLEDDGVIDEVERKLLNRKMEKYDISKVEAEQIEQELLFNSDELKYIEEYKLLLIEGEIGELEQRMLLRYAKRYNINEERQIVLNNTIK
jgi:hypothetical protein